MTLYEVQNHSAEPIRYPIGWRYLIDNRSPFYTRITEEVLQAKRRCLIFRYTLYRGTLHRVTYSITNAVLPDGKTKGNSGCGKTATASRPPPLPPSAFIPRHCSLRLRLADCVVTPQHMCALGYCRMTHEAHIPALLSSAYMYLTGTG